MIVEALQAPPDNQAHVFRHVDFVDRNVSAELTGRIKHSPLLDQMPVQLFDEEGISLASIKDEARQTVRNLALA